MKELVAICGYTDNLEKSNLLASNLTILKKAGYETLLVNHYPVDPIFYKDFDYYLYDKDNELIDDDRIKFFFTWNQQDLHFWTKNDIKNWHAYAALRLFFAAMKFAKGFEYDVLHLVEYDTILYNTDELKDNLEYVKQGYDGVVYNGLDIADGITGNCKENLITFDVKKLRDFNFTREWCLQMLEQYWGTPEQIIWHEFIRDYNYYMKQYVDDNPSFKIDTQKQWLLENGVAFANWEGKLALVCKGLKYDNTIEVILNKQDYFVYETPASHWRVEWYNELSTYHDIKIIVNGKVFTHIKFESEEDRVKFSEHNYGFRKA
jgi:hypothetical protein